MTDATNWKNMARAALAEAREADLEPVALVNEDGTPAAATLATKPAVMAGILQAIASMAHEDLMQWLTDVVQMPGLDIAAQNQASIQMRGNPLDAGVTVKEEAKGIFGDELNEEQLDRVSTLIESLVKLRSTVEAAKMEEAFVEMFDKTVTEALEEQADKVDQYVTYAAEQWVEKNEVAIESALKVERADRLIEGLQRLMAEAGVEITEETVDVVEGVTARAEELEAQLNEQVADNMALRDKIAMMEAAEAFREVSEGLTMTDVERFKTLVEDIELGGDVEELTRKLMVIREAHFKSTPAAGTGINEATDLNEETSAPNTQNAVADPRMASLSEALSRASRDRYAKPRG